MVTTATTLVRLSPHGKIYFLQATHINEIKMRYLCGKFSLCRRILDFEIPELRENRIIQV
jgi:hypothetical protein